MEWEEEDMDLGACINGWTKLGVTLANYTLWLPL
jgi:hypothetical protein